MTKTQIFKRMIIISTLLIFGSRLVELTTFRLINFFSPDLSAMAKLVVLSTAQFLMILLPIVTIITSIISSTFLKNKSDNDKEL